MNTRINRTTQIKSKALAIAAPLVVAGTLVTGSAFIHVHMTASQPHAAAVEYIDSATATPEIEYMDSATATPEIEYMDLRT